MIAFVRGVIAASAASAESHGASSAGDVGEHRRRARVADGVDAGDEGQRRDDHLVAGPRPAATHIRCRPTVQLATASAWRAPVYCGEGGLELLGPRAHAEPARAVDVRDDGDVVLGHDDVGKGNGPLRHAATVAGAWDSLDAQPVEHAGPAAPRRHLGLGASASLFVQVAPLVGVTMVSVVVARRLGPQRHGGDRADDRAARGAARAVRVRADDRHHVPRRAAATGARATHSARASSPPPCSGVLGVVVGLVFFVITRDEVFAGSALLSAVLGIGHLPFKLARGFTGAIALARERYEAYAAFELVGTAVLSLAAVPLTFVWGSTARWRASPRPASRPACAAAVVGGSLRARRAAAAACAAGSRCREAAVFGSKAWGATLLQLINYRLDLFLSPPSCRAPSRPLLRRAVGDRARLGAPGRAGDGDLPAHRRPARRAGARRDRRRGVRPGHRPGGTALRHAARPRDGDRARASSSAPCRCCTARSSGRRCGSG